MPAAYVADAASAGLQKSIPPPRHGMNVTDREASDAVGSERCMKPAVFACVFAAIALSCAGCGIVKTAARGPLPTVTQAPTPNAAPLISSYSPRGEVDTLAQIRIEFKKPIIPLERLESPDENAKLAFFTISPQLPGRFRFLTPRLIGFQADGALPIATRIGVTVRAGLTDT